MRIELDPPQGITGFPFGMPAEQVKEAAATMLGRIEVQDEGSDDPFGYMTVLATHRPEEITVTFRGTNVFTTPARELLGQLESMGFSITQREPDHPLVPGLSLGFTREAGHDVPLDTDGEPLYFQAVYVGPEDCYDFLDDLEEP